MPRSPYSVSITVSANSLEKLAWRTLLHIESYIRNELLVAITTRASQLLVLLFMRKLWYARVICDHPALVHFPHDRMGISSVMLNAYGFWLCGSQLFYARISPLWIVVVSAWSFCLCFHGLRFTIHLEINFLSSPIKSLSWLLILSVYICLRLWVLLVTSIVKLGQS